MYALRIQPLVENHYALCKRDMSLSVAVWMIENPVHVTPCMTDLVFHDGYNPAVKTLPTYTGKKLLYVRKRAVNVLTSSMVLSFAMLLLIAMLTMLV